MLIQRDLIGPVTPLPEPVPIARLVHGDPVNPGSQAGLTTKPMNRLEDAKKDFLREVERFLAIAEQISSQLHHRPLMLGNELRGRTFIARGATLDERRFAIADI